MNLALFDLDNTLLTGDSDFEWAQFLISKGIVDRELQEAKNIQFYEQYKAGTLDIHEFLAFQLAPLTRHSRAELDAWHREYMDRHILPIIGTAARTLVNKHLDAGDLCAIVTATNSFVTGPITREFGIPHLIGTVPAVNLKNAFHAFDLAIAAPPPSAMARSNAWKAGSNRSACGGAALPTVFSTATRITTCRSWARSEHRWPSIRTIRYAPMPVKWAGKSLLCGRIGLFPQRPARSLNGNT